MPELSFDLNLGALLSPVLLGVLAWMANGVKKANERRVDERHAQTGEHLDRIEGKVDKTNGRVTTLETEHKADHDTLTALKGTVDALFKLKGETP